MDSLDRQFAAARARLERERRKWWAARIVWAAEVLDRDPRELLDECAPAIARGSLLPFDVEWPVGLRSEDEPQMRPDRRFGRRPRATS